MHTLFLSVEAKVRLALTRGEQQACASLHQVGCLQSAPIVYEDNELIVVNKPSGMLVHPAGSAFVWALIGLIRDLYPEDDADLVHWLDRETSGAVIISKNKATNARLKWRFKRQIHKIYRAIVRGVPSGDEYDLHAPIDIDPVVKLIWRCVREGQASHTHSCSKAL